MARVFITGSTDGLGRAAALSLLNDGHEVVVHARSPERSAQAADMTARGAVVVVGDLRSADETRGVAAQVNGIGRMDAVIHNAGVYNERSRAPTPESHPTLVAVNTLAPFILTALIARPRRLVFLSSGLHRGGEGPLDDMDWTRRPWNAARAYAESKLHVVALALTLARRWPETLCHAVDPGWARTRMGGASAPVDVETGARTQAWLAVSEDPAAKVTGRYWRHMREEQPAEQATDARFQDELLTRLSEMTGLQRL